MNMRNLLKPEYVWRPTQIFYRLIFRPSRQLTPLALPWHCSISACSAEVIGRSIATQGVYDLPLTEAIIRLTDPGDIALDLGANIGYATLVLALAVGPEGRVISFEPNPAILPTLRQNVANWNSLPIGVIHIEDVALSDRDGEGVLGFPEDYMTNYGAASLELNQSGVHVRLRRLDSFVPGRTGIMKVDVEGHEASVFKGGEKMLARRLVRDILFEEHNRYPAPAHNILLEHGYSIFRVTRSAWRPLLLPPEHGPRQAYLPPNYLATIDPARAVARFRPWGWRALSTKLRRNTISE